jgi:hypothetical protein
MEEQILKAALKWAQAIESRFPENVLRMYHPDGALWGTLAQEFRFGHQEIFGYFVNFLNKEDLKCEFKDGYVRLYEEFAFYSGSYEFTWNFADKIVVLPARFSFVYKREEGNWLILEHHSSMFPDKPFRIRRFFRK